jgi:hypothetical protein
VYYSTLAFTRGGVSVQIFSERTSYVAVYSFLKREDEKKRERVVLSSDFIDPTI